MAFDLSAITKHRLTLTKDILDRAGLTQEKGIWILGSELYQNVHEYIIRNKEELIFCFPTIANTLQKMDGTRAKDTRLIASYIRRLCGLYKIKFVFNVIIYI